MRYSELGISMQKTERSWPMDIGRDGNIIAHTEFGVWKLEWWLWVGGSSAAKNGVQSTFLRWLESWEPIVQKVREALGYQNLLY